MNRNLLLCLIPFMLFISGCASIDNPTEKKQCKVNIVGKTITQDCRK